MLPNQKQKARAVPPKPKWIVYIGKSEKMFFEADLKPKKSSEGAKKCKKVPNCGPIKNKGWGCTFTKSFIQFKSFSKSAF